MTTTVQNVFADTLVTATAANGPNISVDEDNPTSTSTASQSYSSNWPGYDPDGPTNTYDSTKYVYQVQFNYTSVNIIRGAASLEYVEVAKGTQSTSNLATTFNYRGSGTQAGATNNLPASVSTTQFATGTFDGGQGAFNATYSVSRTFNVNASWHWEGNLFTIDGVGGDTLPTMATQATVTATGGLLLGGNVSATVDTQCSVTGNVLYDGNAQIESQIASTVSSGVIKGFVFPDFDGEYVAQGDSAQGEYVEPGDSAQGEYVEQQIVPDLTNTLPSDGQLTCVAGFVKSGEMSVAVDVQTAFSGIVRPSIQGEASISSDAQTSITAVNIFGPVASTMDIDTSTTATAGNLILVGGENYHNLFVEEGYTTPETYSKYSIDSNVTAIPFRIFQGEGIIESASQITVQGGYLQASGELLLGSEIEFTINQTAGTIAGLLFDGAANIQTNTQFSSDADRFVDTTYILSADLDIQTVGGYKLSATSTLESDAVLGLDATIIPGASLFATIDSQLTAQGGFLKDLAASIQSDGFALTVAQYKIVDPFRTIRVKTETRTILVAQEDRLVLIDDETRVNKVGQEIRSYMVPQETRLIKAQHLILDRGTPVGSNERRIG